jgi:DNA-binding SARP family transcriptional activator/tetratricopeptide (TPR) repeat protein
VYQLQLFGLPTLTDSAGRAIPIGRPAAALLALLSRARGCVLDRERAAALLWPDSDEAAARRALRQLLFRLRPQAQPVIAADRAQVRLRDVAVDVLAFEEACASGRVEEAAAIQQAAFLEGFVLPRNAPFEQWADGERAGLRRMLADALERLVADAGSRGRWDEALRAAERWLAVEPFSERAVTGVISVRAQLGDRAAALAAWSAFRARLADELGTTPPASLQQLVERLQRGVGGQPASRGAGGSGRAVSMGAGPARSTGEVLPLVGREAEFARLNERWAAARGGAAQLVVLHGEAGIGKTRLAAEFAHWAASGGATTLSTRAYEIEAGVPYAALAAALREALRAPGLSGVEASTLAELGRIVPEYATRFPASPAIAGDEFETGRLRIMDAFRDLLDSLTHEAPVLFVIDDLPFADEATLASMHYAMRRLADRPLLWLATARASNDAELRGPGSFLRAAAPQSPAAVVTLELRPLARAAIEHLGLLLDAPGSATCIDAARLEQRSGGNPLFITELLRAAAEGRPEAAPNQTIRLITLDRIAAVHEEARTLLRAAAVLGRQFPLRVARIVAGLSAGRAAAAVDQLAAHGLLRQVEYGYDFVHDVVREAVLAGLGTESRRALHSQAFAALYPDTPSVAGPARVGAELASALARHAAGAGMRAEAHRWHLVAARAAIALYATVEASRALAAALEFAADDEERHDAWLAIADFARTRSDFRGAAYALRQAYDTTHDQDVRVRLRLRMLHMGTRAGLLSSADVEALAAELAADLSADAGRGSTDTAAELLFVRADAAARSGDLERAEHCAGLAAAAYRGLGDGRPLVRTLLLEAAVNARRNGERALALLTEAEAVAERDALQPELLDVRVERATELSRLGRWDESLAALAALKRAALEAGDWSNAAIASINAGDLHVRRGDWQAARREFDETGSICGRFDFPHVAVVIGVNLALLEWWRGAGDAAIDVARTARLQADSIGLDAPAAAAAAVEALARLERGDADGAAAVLDGVAAAPAQHVSWSDDAELVTIAKARLLAAHERVTDAVELLRRARRHRRDPYAKALLDCECAALLAREQPAAAAARAKSAADVAAALGARPLAARAAALLPRT